MTSMETVRRHADSGKGVWCLGGWDDPLCVCHVYGMVVWKKKERKNMRKPVGNENLSISNAIKKRKQICLLLFATVQCSKMSLLCPHPMLPKSGPNSVRKPKYLYDHFSPLSERNEENKITPWLFGSQPVPSLQPSHFPCCWL
jgi:hypothetical protein